MNQSEENSNSSNASMAKSEAIADIRETITQIDNEFLLLLAKRRQCSEAVAKQKKHINKPLRDHLRERELIERLVKKANQLNLDPHYVTRIFNTIIEDSVQFQQDYLQLCEHPELKTAEQKSLAVLGGKGAYSYLAAKRFFSHSGNDFVACPSFEQVLQNVENGSVDYGVIPIENTTSGGITEVYDLLLGSNLTIVGDQKYAVMHCLVAASGAKLEDITQIAAHPQASRQCNKNLKELTSANIHLVQSTAHALELVVNQTQSNVAAVASEEAAQLFGLDVLKSNIANQSENITRFLVLSRNPVKVSSLAECKTSIALSTGQKAGSLAEVLGLFHQANIPLTRLESRPIPNKPWEQMFYIDLLGNINDENVEKTIQSLSRFCRFLRVLGSYQIETVTACE